MATHDTAFTTHTTFLQLIFRKACCATNGDTCKNETTNNALDVLFGAAVDIQNNTLATTTILFSPPSPSSTTFTKL